MRRQQTLASSITRSIKSSSVTIDEKLPYPSRRNSSGLGSVNSPVQLMPYKDDSGKKEPYVPKTITDLSSSTIKADDSPTEIKLN